MRVICYARVSTDSQRDNNVSLDDQLKAMRRYCHDKGWTIYSEVKESWSGYEYDREFMDSIREEAKRRTFDILLVYRTDRFARDEAVFMLLERFFKKHGIRLFSVEDGEFTPGVINRYLAAINRAKAQDEADTFKKRSRDARQAYAQQGVPPGQSQAVFGYSKEGKKRDTRYIINPKEADIVRFIFELFVEEGVSCIEIANQLTTMGTQPPSAMRGINRGKYGRWHNTTIRKILGNTAYIGKLVIFKEKVVDGKQIKTAKDEQITIPVPHIIDQRTFDRAQYLLSQKSVNFRDKRHKVYYLAGMVYCSCGFAMSGTSVGKERKHMEGLRYNYFYKCSAYSKVLGRAKCGNKAVPALELEACVWGFVERLIRDPKTTLALYQKDQSAKDALLSNVQERLAAIDSLIDDGTEELRRLQRMYQRGGCDDQYFDAEKKRIDDQRTALDREREKAQRLLDRNKNAIAQLAELEEIGEELRSSLLGITEERKRRIYQRLRLHVTAEFTESGQGNSGSNRHVVIEVLGFSERVSIRNTAAPSRVFDTSLRDPLMFRVPLSHPQ